MVVNSNPLLYDVEVIMKKPELNHTGVFLTTLFLKNVRDSAFDGDTDTFYAVLADGSMYVTPKENVYSVVMKPAKEE